MAKNPPYNRPLTDSTNFGVIQGSNQEAYPIPLSTLKDFIVGGAQKVGEVTFSANAFSVTFGTPLSSANFIVAFLNLPDNVNVTSGSITTSVNGFSGTYIGEGAGTGGFIAAVTNN